MDVRGFGLPIEDYLLTCVTNATAAKPEWRMLRGGDLQRLRETSLEVARNLAKRTPGLTIKAVLGAVENRIATQRPEYLERWRGLVLADH